MYTIRGRYNETYSFVYGYAFDFGMALLKALECIEYHKDIIQAEIRGTDNLVHIILNDGRLNGM